MVTKQSPEFHPDSMKISCYSPFNTSDVTVPPCRSGTPVTTAAAVNPWIQLDFGANITVTQVTSVNASATFTSELFIRLYVFGNGQPARIKETPDDDVTLSCSSGG